MAESTVQVQRNDRVLTLTLCREQVRNALDLETIELLRQQLAAAGRDDEVRAVVLTGAGDKAFCAGADLSLIARFKQLPPDTKNPFAELVTALLDCPKPLIGRVGGSVLGGGVALLLACDLTIAADDVVISSPEVQVGLFPFMVLPLLLHHVGPKAAAEMALTGRKISAGEAVTLGLLNRAVPRAQLDETVAATVKELLRGGPHAQARGKQALGALVRRGLAEQTEQMAEHFRRCLDDPEVEEGAAAFLQKRPPAWTR